MKKSEIFEKAIISVLDNRTLGYKEEIEILRVLLREMEYNESLEKREEKKEC